MKKYFLLCLMAIAILAQAKTYTLSELVELVPALEDSTIVTEVASYTVGNNYNGIFIFDGLEPGNYILDATIDGYKPLLDEYNPVPANATSTPLLYIKSESCKPPKEVFENYLDSEQPGYLGIANEYIFSQDEGTTYDGVVGNIAQMLQYGDSIIVLSHEGTLAHLYIIDNNTKQLVKELNTEGLFTMEGNPGFYNQIGSIALSADRKLVGVTAVRTSYSDGNVPSGYQRGTMHAYYWDNFDAAPTDWFASQYSCNWYNSDLGFGVAVSGPINECIVCVPASTSGSTRGVRIAFFVIHDGNIVSTSRANSNATIALTELGDPLANINGYPVNNFGRIKVAVSPFDDQAFIIGGSKTGKLYEFPLTADGAVPTYNILTEDGLLGNGMHIFKHVGHTLMVAPYGKKNDVKGIKLYDITNGIANATLVETTNTDLNTAKAITANTADFVWAGAEVIQGDIHAYLAGSDANVVKFTTDGIAQPWRCIKINLLPSASDGKYKDMYIVAKNDSTGKISRCLVTNNMSYNIYVPSKSTYDITIENSIGVQFGEIKGVQVNGEDVEVTFPSLLTPQSVALAVTLPSNEDITDKVGVTWSDSEDNFLAQGPSVSSLASGMTLKYDIKLPQDLAMEYEQPGITEYTVKDGNNGFVVKLQTLGKSTISGKVCDKATGAPLNRATTTISQILNGKHSVSSTATTDKDGNFSAEVYKAPSKVTVAANDYVSLTTDISITDDVSLGTMLLDKIDGAVINIGFTYQASVKQGETVTVQDFFEDYNNVSYSIYNKTQKKDISQFSAQYPEIVLLEDVNEGDELVVTAHSIKGEFNDVQASCVINDKKAAVTLPIVEHGAIEAVYSESQTDNVVGMLFNSNGEQVTRDAYYNKSLSLSNINDGEYTLVTMQANDYMNSVLTLSSLASMGMKSGDDYISSKVTVNSGTISDVQVADVPAIDTSELLYTSSNTYFTANKPSVTVGNYVTLSANIDFKKAYQGQVKNLSLIFDLPQGCEFVDNSVMMGNSVHSYSVNDNKIIISDPVCGESIKFCVIPTKPGLVQPSAMLQFTINGKQVTQPIGSALVEAKGLDINVPATTNSSEIAISGFAPYNSSVEVFDGDKLIGTTKSGLSGNWNLTASLTDTFNYSVHEIQAHATTPQGKELMSESVDCLYDNSYIVPQTITLIYRNYTSVFYPMEKRTVGTYYSYVPGSPEFTLIAQFNTDSPDKLANVMFNVLTSDNKIKAFPAVYDEATGKWVASAEFPSSYSLPVNVNVSYDVIKDTPDDLSPNLLFDIENADHIISEAMSVIQDKFTAKNCTYDDENISFNCVSEELGLNWSCNIQLLDYDIVESQMAGDNEFIEVENDGKHIWVKIWDDNDAVHSISVSKEEKIAISYDIILNEDNNAVSGNGMPKVVGTVASFVLPIISDYLLANTMLKQTSKLLENKILSLEQSLEAIEAMAKWKCSDGTFLFEEDVRSSIYYFVAYRKNKLNEMKVLVENLKNDFYNFRDDKITIGLLSNVAAFVIPSSIFATCAEVYVSQKINDAIRLSYYEFMNKILRENMSQFANLEQENIQFTMSLRNKKRNCDNEEEPTNTDFPTPPIHPAVDPSGFVYEAVPSNRLQGVTATIYYKETVEDMYGEPVEQEVMWDAEEYAQKNPLFTDENGMYQWDVPQGMWQVRFNKNGYEPTRSEWLPVPPPQLDVNIGMTQLRQPEVAMVHAYKDGVVLTFDKFMRPATLTTENVSVTQNGENVTGTIELMNEEQGDNEKFASKLRFVPSSEFTANTVTLNVKNDVESYSGIRMNSDFTQSFDIEKQIYVIGIDTLINVGYGESRQVLVEALPVDVAKGKTLNVRSVQPLIAEVDNETYTLDKHGRATVTVNGNLPGATSLTLNVEGFDLKKHAVVQVVDESSRVTEKPVASVVNGLVFDEGFTVELSCSTPDAVIYYTTNGACPCDEEERILYDGPIPISTSTTIMAIAIAPGYYESDIATYYYFQSSAIDEISYDAPFKVTPTMVRDGFVVKGNFYECDVTLYSLNGRMMLHNEHVGSSEFVSLSSLNSGVYIAVVTINGRPYPVKIVKM